MSAKPIIAILGGTGDLGSGLAKRWIKAGYSVVIGSRSADKARSFSKELGGDVRGDDNVGAAKSADIIVLAVPFGSHEATLLEVKNAVQGKIVVSRSRRHRLQCGFEKSSRRRKGIAMVRSGVMTAHDDPSI